MKNGITILLVCLSFGVGKTQTEAPTVEDLFTKIEQQMQQMIEQLGQSENGFMEIDTLFFLQPGEQNDPLGALPPAVENAEMEQLLEQLRKSMEGMNSVPLLDLEEFFRSFGQIQVEPRVPIPENIPKPQPEEKSKPKKKRKIYRL